MDAHALADALGAAPALSACAHAPTAQATQARALIAAGFALVPIPLGSKGPRTNGWQKAENAWTRVALVPDDYSGNIGVIHAHSGTAALDLDDLTQASVALAKEGFDVASLLSASDAVQIRSNRPNRNKLLYRIPVGAVLRTFKRDGYELRCDGAQDVLPPSIHPDTRQPYEWGGSGDWRNLPLIPPALLAWWKHALEPSAPHQSTEQPADVTHATTIITPQQTTELRSALASMRADDRGLWIKIAACLRSLGEVGRGLWIEWAQTSPKWQPLDAQEWETIAHDRAGYRGVFTAAQSAGWINPARLDARAPITTDTPAAYFVEVDLTDTATPPEQEWIVAGLVPSGHVTLLGAHGGAGKSTLALSIAAHVAAGQPWVGRQVIAGRAVFVSLEDPATLCRRRLNQIVMAYGLSADDAFANLCVLDATAGDTALAAESAQYGARSIEPTALYDNLRQRCAGAKLVIVDNASDAFNGNENDRRQVRAFIRMLATIARENNGGVILLAHIDKASAKFGARGNAYSGSSAWHNSARSRLALTTDYQRVALVQEKNNLAPCVEPIYFQWSATGTLIPAATLDSLTAPSWSGDGGDALAEQVDADALLRAIQAAHDAGAQVSAARSGPATAQTTLSTFTELPQSLRRAAGRSRFWTAMDRLRKEGRIEIKELWSASRHLRRCIVPAATSPVLDRALIPTPLGGETRETRDSPIR